MKSGVLTAKEMMNLDDIKETRSWDSVCGDCAHLQASQCEVKRVQMNPQDSFAAVCECFKDGAREGKQNRQTDVNEIKKGVE